MQLGGALERGHQAVEGSLDGEILVEHRLLEGDGFGHAPGVAVEVVAPQSRVEATGVGGLGLEEEADHIRAPGLEELDAQHEVEGRVVAVGEPTVLEQRAGPLGHGGVFTIGKGMLVGDGEGPAVTIEPVGGDLGGLICAERGAVDEREVRHVQEVVGQEPDRRSGPHGGHVTGREAGVARLGDLQGCLGLGRERLGGDLAGTPGGVGRQGHSARLRVHRYRHVAACAFAQRSMQA